MSYEKIDRRALRTWPLAERTSELQIEKIALDPDSPAPVIRPPAGAPGGGMDPQLRALTDRVVAARHRGASVMLVYGAHLIKNGAGPLVNRLIERGWVTHVGTHGAGVIHDWEFAFAGESSESVRNYAPCGRFGSWEETGRNINLVAIAAAAEGIGFGEGIGRFIAEDGLTLPVPEALAEQIASDPAGPLAGGRADLLRAMQTFDVASGRYEVAHPFKRFSVPAACYSHGVPFTVHPGIGYDIFANHPMFHAAALGRASGTDADIFTHSILNLDGGVYISIGSAIMSPQVFEKAFSAANNLRQQTGRDFLQDHYIAVVDIQEAHDWDWTQGEPPKEHPAYYLRFCKTFHRMGGTVDYLCGDNRVVLANLVSLLRDQSPE